MGKKAAAVLLGIILLLAGGTICIKPICADVVKRAFLARAVAFRANEVLWNWYPDEDTDKALKIQTMIMEHRQLNRIAVKYLNALAEYRSSGRDFREPDVSGNLKKMNESVLDRLESEFGGKMTQEGRTALLNELYEIEQEAIDRLNELPVFIRNFGEPAWLALGFYQAWTSRLFFLALAVTAAWLCFYTFRREEQKGKWLQRMAIVLLIDGAALGLVLPAMIRAVSYRVTNRMIGRAEMLDTSAPLYTGLAFALLAAGMLLARKIIITKEGEGI